ncbi:MAG: hypothetical protein FWD59_06020 [Micrococcales bacterium]|nr:hypothetical protein [Micrococcales bacterium]
MTGSVVSLSCRRADGVVLRFGGRLGGVLVVCSLVLAGCTSPEASVDALIEASGLVGRAAERAKAAVAAADCLVGLGIPTQANIREGQPVSITPSFDKDALVEYPNPSGGGALAGEVPAAAPGWLVAKWEEMRVGHHSGDALLFVEDQDRSADFSRCLSETGYTPPLG